MMERNLKGKSKLHSGITLVALVITIVILIILAVISINAVFGDNGLLSTTEMGATEHRGGRVEEEVAMWKGETKAGQYGSASTRTKEEVIDELLKQGLLTEEEAKQAREQGQVTIGSKTIYFTEDSQTSINYDHIMDKDSNIKVETYSVLDQTGKTKIEGMKKYPLAQSDNTVNSVITSFDSNLSITGDPNSYGACVLGSNYRRLASAEDWETNSNHGLFTLEFATNAKEIALSASGTLRISVDENDGKGYMHTNEQGYIDKEADKRNLGQHGYEPTQFKYYIITFPDAKDRNIKIELKGGIANLYANDEEGKYAIKAIDRTSKTIMFVGDSWTTGCTQIDGELGEIQYLSYPTVIGDNLGMTTMNCGVGGTGYTKDCAPDLTNYQERFKETFENCKLDPDVIVVCGGGNDVSQVKWANKTMEYVINSAKSCLKYIREQKPTTKVIVFGTEFGNSERYNNSKDLLGQLDSALKESAKENNMCFVDFINGKAYDEEGQLVYDGDGPFVSDASDVLPGDVHLTFEGYKKMGDKLTPIVAQLIK